MEKKAKWNKPQKLFIDSGFILIILNTFQHTCQLQDELPLTFWLDSRVLSSLDTSGSQCENEMEMDTALAFPQDHRVKSSVPTPPA